ncbi:MAG: flagellar hook-basal body complex protein FliE [Tissierellia bacterium]|nr:flagellar hook-basal body complex protein FliE [Tissierellia bacterium]
MRIDPLTSLYNSMSVKGVIDEEYMKPKQTTFGDVLKDAVTRVNDDQIKSNKMKQDLLLGRIDNPHDVLIQSEKASLSLQALMAVRSKIVEAYKEIMRIQI